MEHDEQVALFEWAGMQECVYPELRLLHAIPNGGWRAKKTGVWLKAEGVKPGVPDVCLPVPRGGYNGLYIEMKYGRNKLTENQQAWALALRQYGYDVAVCWSFEEARDHIEAYLHLEPGAKWV